MSETPVLLPVPDERSAPFFEGAREGRLMLQRCSACECWLYPVRSRCPDCGSRALEWSAASGRGVVYSHGVLHRAPPGLWHDAPLTLAVVELAEGVRISSNLVYAEGSRVHAGMPVEVAFEPLSDGISLPVFRPAER